MASLRLKTALLRSQPSLWNKPVQNQTFIVQKFVSTQLSRTACLGIRAYSQPSQGKQILLRDHGVFADYVPPENPPSITNFKEWRLTKWRNLRNNVQNLLSVGLLKYKSQFDKWNTNKFLTEAVETYKDMNDSFARGDRSILEEVCLDAMYSNLKNQLKNRNNVRWEWKYYGEVERPRIVCLRCVSTTGLSKHGFAVGQATVRMFTKQSMAIYDKKNRLIGGDPNKVHDIVEYVVFQKTISDPEDMWRIYGKIANPEKMIKN